MHIALLHTADVHIATFDKLFQKAAHKVRLTHKVGAHLLRDARANGLETVRDETIATLESLSNADAVLCTCSTIGPCADETGAVRIDRPLMQAACDAGPKPLVVYCLESTRAPTVALLEETAQSRGLDISPDYLLCDDAWPAFEAGDLKSFVQALEYNIRHSVDPDTSCVVLAQASMAVAADSLADLRIPIQSSPALAVKATLAQAYANANMPGS